MTQQLANTGGVPDWANSRPPEGFESLSPEESLGEGIGSSYPIIGYKGKIWSIRHQGNNHILVRPDDGSPMSYIDVVILRSPKVKAKSYYPDGFEENASSGKRPTCASIDGVKPDPDVIQQQSPLCATCKHNEFYTDQNGRKTRDCSDYKRLAVLVMPNQTVRLFGTPLMEPAFLRVPPASLQKLLTFGDNMAKQGWPYSSFITRISFDPQKSHPEFDFKALQALTPKEAPVIIQMREDMASKRITGEDEIARRERVALAAPGTGGAGQGTAPALPAQSPAPVQQGSAGGVPTVGTQARITPPTVAPPQAVATPEPNPGLDAFTAGAPVTAKVTVPANTVVDLQPNAQGAFSIEVPVEPNPNPQPGAMVGQTAADVGASAVDDPDLDKKIAAMLATQ
jgi:hypothetical protein